MGSHDDETWRKVRDFSQGRGPEYRAYRKEVKNDEAKLKAARDSAARAAKRRKQKPRTGNGWGDNVIDTGMFD